MVDFDIQSHSKDLHQLQCEDGLEVAVMFYEIST